MQKLFKLVLLGDREVGKTSIRKRHLGVNFEARYLTTLGADLSIKTIGGVKYQIWDVGGHPSFKEVSRGYYSGCHGIILVFSITDSLSLEHLTDWLNEVMSIVGNKVPCMVLGNKIDLQDGGDTISSDTIKDKISDLVNNYQTDIFYMTTSARTGENIDKAFSRLYDLITS